MFNMVRQGIENVLARIPWSFFWKKISVQNKISLGLACDTIFETGSFQNVWIIIFWLSITFSIQIWLTKAINDFRAASTDSLSPQWTGKGSALFSSTPWLLRWSLQWTPSIYRTRVSSANRRGPSRWWETVVRVGSPSHRSLTRRPGCSSIRSTTHKPSVAGTPSS